MRRLLCLLVTVVMSGMCPAAAQQVDISTGSVAETVAGLRPGEFVWVPQAAPNGPLLLIVNLRAQRAVLYRNGVPIAAATISTGKQGRETPTGVFTILQKRVEHYSSKYDNAPMPYMQRLTWQGVALHGGRLPGYPASHGCIRLPAAFAKLLYGVTSLGMTVVITSGDAQPRIAPSPSLVSLATGTDSTDGQHWNPAKSPTGPVSVVVSTSDRKALVLRNGVVIGSAGVTVSGTATGSWAYALRSVDAQGRQSWIRVPLSSSSDAQEAVPLSEWQRFKAPEWFRTAVRQILAPGATIIVTTDSLQNRALAASSTVMEGDTTRN
jgi:hypothetical protein